MQDEPNKSEKSQEKFERLIERLDKFEANLFDVLTDRLNLFKQEIVRLVNEHVGNIQNNMENSVKKISERLDAHENTLENHSKRLNNMENRVTLPSFGSDPFSTKGLNISNLLGKKVISVGIGIIVINILALVVILLVSK